MSHHSILLRIPAGQNADAFIEQIYGDLKAFKYFNKNHNTEASVSIRRGTAYFTMLGFDGLLSEYLVGNAGEVPVKLSFDDKRHLVIGDTLEGHMLEGTRSWRVILAPEAMYGGEYVKVITGSRDRPVGFMNNFGAAFAGTDAQMLVWKQYLQNFADAYGQEVIINTVGPVPLMGN
jgi:hypothetical protein